MKKTNLNNHRLKGGRIFRRRSNRFWILITTVMGHIRKIKKVVNAGMTRSRRNQYQYPRFCSSSAAIKFLANLPSRDVCTHAPIAITEANNAPITK